MVTRLHGINAPSASTRTGGKPSLSYCLVRNCARGLRQTREAEQQEVKKKKKRTKTTVGAPPPRDGVRPASCVLLNLGHIHNRLHYKIPKLIYFTSSTR